MNDKTRVECPNCHYITGKFCDICDGKGFTIADRDLGFIGSMLANQLNAYTYANKPSRDEDVVRNSTEAARKALEAQINPRKLAYSSPDPEGEKRRLAALNLAMNAYQLNMTGYQADGKMQPEDIVSLASRMEKFIKGEGYSPHEE